MIAVLFPSGGFGSTLEYCLRQFSNELTKIKTYILADGSMHGYRKELHPVGFREFLDRANETFEVITPVYPTEEHLTPCETVEKWKTILPSDAKVVLVSFDTVEQAERNQLFVYHKLPGVLDNILKDKAQEWNESYISYNDMKRQEIREALSLHIDTMDSYTSIRSIADPQWLVITPDDVLYNFKETLIKMFDHCGLTFNDRDVDGFYNDWFPKQQYVIDEYQETFNITDAVKNDQVYVWEPLSLMGESIVQSRLRRQGQNIYPDDVEVFPTDSIGLIMSLRV